MNNKLFFSSELQTGKTPTDLYNDLDKEFNFDFDPCPTDPKFDGLQLRKWGKSNYVNPPYNNQKAWVERALFHHWDERGTIIVMLLPARTDTKLFHDIILPFAKEIRFIKGRLRFEQYNNSAPFPSMIVIFKHD